MTNPETKFVKRIKRDMATLILTKGFKTQERARKGVPDLLYSLVGLHLVIEAKDDGEEPTPLQTVILNEYRAVYGLAIWTTPSDWDLHFKIIKEKHAERLKELGVREPGDVG